LLLRLNAELDHHLEQDGEQDATLNLTGADVTNRPASTNRFASHLPVLNGRENDN
jgi:hypothetical protein